MRNVICQKCADINVTSTLTVTGSQTTCAAYAPFYDEQGRKHYHNCNIAMASYRCSNGHYFNKQDIHSCWCGWKQESK